MKKSTLIRKEVRDVDTPAEFVKTLQNIEGAKLKEAKKNVTLIKQQIESYTSALKNNEGALTEYEATVKSLTDESKAKKEEVAKQAEALWGKFMRNVCVDTIVVTPDGQNLDIRTTLLFADIRKSAGSRSSDRACLGAFRILIPLHNRSKDYVWVENQTFSPVNHLQHWAISSNRICWGNWADEVRDSLRVLNFYEVFEIILALLRASDEDAAAYCRSHEWRDRRVLNNFGEGVIWTGDYVIFTVKEHEGLEILGYTAQCLKTYAGYNMYAFKEIMIGGAPSRGFTWTVPHGGVRKITKEEYDARSRYPLKVENTDAGALLSTIDELPTGSKNSDVNATRDELSSIRMPLELSKLMTA